MTPKTGYAPVERATWEELYTQMIALRSNTALQGMVLSAPEHVLLLNTHRQIVYANNACQKMLCGDEDPALLYGCRPGEPIHCVYAKCGEGGCGTSKYCHICGAVNAVLHSLEGNIDVRQCSIKCMDEETPIELIIFTMPLNIQDTCYILVMMKTPDEAGQNSNSLAQHAFTMQKFAANIEQSQYQAG